MAKRIRSSPVDGSGGGMKRNRLRRAMAIRSSTSRVWSYTP